MSFLRDLRVEHVFIEQRLDKKNLLIISFDFCLGGDERRTNQPLDRFETGLLCGYFSSCRLQRISVCFSGKLWLDLKFHKNQQIVKLDEIENTIDDPPDSIRPEVLDRIQGSLVGLALGDALGAHVEFRPRDYLVDHPVHDLGEGGTWGLRKGQVSMQFSPIRETCQTKFQEEENCFYEHQQ